MVVLLIGDDLPDGRGRSRVAGSKFRDLILKMPQDDAFDRDGRCRDGPAPNQAGKYPKGQSSETAKMEAPASANASARHLGSEQVAMLPLLLQKFIELRQHVWRAPPGEPALRSINANRAMLAGMIDLEDPISAHG